MSNIKLSDVLETLREGLGVKGQVYWEDFGDIKINFETKDGEVPCLSLYMGDNKESDTLYIDIGEDN